MTRILPVAELYSGSPGDRFVILDVRSPAEFAQGHIPGAISFPLFTDGERAEVGKTYKHQGPGAAMQLGLQYVAPKMAGMIDRAQVFSQDRELLVHCWRGGKRSESVGWLLGFAGLPVSVLQGGYKAYRQYQRHLFLEGSWPLIVLGGATGSGKTEILKMLRSQGHQVLDLEALASHKGSAFGTIGERPQPTNEQFEIEVFDALLRMDRHRPIWVENESRSIGRVYIPEIVWEELLRAPLICLDVPLARRVENLVETYSTGANDDDLRNAFVHIAKRLGGQHVKHALEALDHRDYTTAAKIALRYYDKAYNYGLNKRPKSAITHVTCAQLTAEEICETLVNIAQDQVCLPENQLSA